MPGRLTSDEPMPDADVAVNSEADQAATNGNGNGNLELLNNDKLRIKMLPNGSDHAASFEFIDEDHTLGNALRYIIMKNPEVEFCGYSIPHPAEPKMNLRIQTYEGTTVWDALAKGMDDLIDLCNVVEMKFIAARDEFMGD